MNLANLYHAKMLLSKGCMNSIYKPVMDFIENKLLILYDENKGIYTADFIVQKMCNIDYIISLLPQQKYPLHEYELILMGSLADISTCFPNYDFRTHYIKSAEIAQSMFGEDLKSFVSDIGYFKKMIERIPFSNKAEINVHYGNGLNGMVLHDADYVTKIQRFASVASYYYDQHEDLDSATKFTKSYLDCKVRYGTQGNCEGLYIKSIGNIDFFSRRLAQVKEALSSEEKFLEFLKEEEKGEP